MFTYFFEARPAPGRYSAYRDQVAALRRALQETSDLLEEREYCSATRNGWFLWLSSWTGQIPVACHRAEAAHLSISREHKRGLLVDYRCRLGYKGLDTEASEASARFDWQPGDDDDSDAVLTVLSKETREASSISGCPQQRAELLGLDIEAQGLVAWDIFDVPDTPGNTAVLLSWKDAEAARMFERKCQRSADSRLRRVHVASDCHPAYRSDSQGPVDQPPGIREREALELLADSGVVLGASLDLVSTAQALTNLLVPRFATAATVDMPDALISEGIVGASSPRALLRMGAAIAPGHVSPAYDPRYSAPQCLPIPGVAASLTRASRVYSPGDAEFSWTFGHDPQSSQYVRDLGIQSVGVVPLSVRTGVGLGVLTVYRWNEPFTANDLNLVQELAGRAATALYNALAYTYERNTAVSLHLAALPRSVPATPALQVRHGFSHTSTDGQWFDVIRLSGARTAFVVGDTTALGFSAATAAMRLRSAVRALSRLDMAPGEVMTRLNDLAVDLDTELASSAQSVSHHRCTCLYLVYDPIQEEITFASACHQPPVVASLDTEAKVLSGVRGPPLGQPSEKYSESRFPIKPGILLALAAYSSADAPTRLIRALGRRGLDVDAGFQAAAEALAPSRPATAPLIVARTNLLGADRTTSWDLPCDIAIVGTTRTLAEQQCDVWGLGEDTKFVATLIVSELVTNAIRHASPPITLRLIRQEKLTCEVSDGSTTTPYLQYALPDDEGGRGLFIVAQCVSRWGVRHGPAGKIIWTEQNLDDG